MNRYHAHPDPTVRYLAHEVVQPVDRWEHDALVVLGAIAFLLLIAGVAVWLGPA